MITNKRILITGGMGFIGTNLCKELCEHNSVSVVDLQESPYFKWLSFTPEEVARYFVDINDTKSMKLVIDQVNPQIIIHCAGMLGIEKVRKVTLDTMFTNGIGTYELMNMCPKNLELFINFSTSEVSGKESFRTNEDDPSHIGTARQARWGYATSKLFTEHLGVAFWRERNLPVVSVRPFNVYGPGQTHEGVVYKFFRSCFDGQDIIVHGDGSQIRSFIYIDDFVKSILALMEYPQEVRSYIFNIGNPTEVYTIKEVAKRVLSVCEKNFKTSTEIVYEYSSHEDVNLRIPNVLKLWNIAYVNPNEFIEFEDGLDRYVQILRAMEDANIRF